ncbi:hypothetical protein Dimus_004636 [Dionaea muscipula]
MATSAFKSTTKRSSIGGATPNSGEQSTSGTNRNSSIHRRSRSVSRFSHRLLPESTAEFGEIPARREKFVNSVRGSGFPEISLNDLAIGMFSCSELAGRGWSSEVWTPDTVSQSRGRSESRHSSRVNGDYVSAGAGGGFSSGRRVANGRPRRRRSVSAVRYQVSDSEDDGHPEKCTINSKGSGFSCGRMPKSLTENPIASNQCKGLQKCSSQKDFSQLHDDYSSHSSVLTEDEALDMQETIQAVHARNRAGHRSRYGVYGTTRKELRNAVQEMKQELQQAINHQDSSESITKDGAQIKECDVLQAVSTSELRKRELLAEMMLEEQRGKELKMIVGKLLPYPNDDPACKRRLRARKRSNDKNNIPEQLSEEAEKIIDDFISSFEDTDISSVDGERSETSSIFGVTTKPRDDRFRYGITQSSITPPVSETLPVEMDGVVLPWLQWETSSDLPPSTRPISRLLSTSQIILQDKLDVSYFLPL